MKKISLIFQLIIPFVILFIFISCNEESTTEPSDSSGPIVINGIEMKSSYVELSSDQIGNITNVTSNSITFSDDPGLEAGDVFVIGVTEHTPKGTLRKVKSVMAKPGVGFNVLTVFASLSELIEAGKIDFDKSLLNIDQSITKELVNGLKINGKFKENGNISGFFDFDGSSLSAELGFKFTGSTDLNLEANLNQSFNNEYEIKDIKLNPVVIWPKPPVIVTPHILLYAIVEGNLNGEVKTALTETINFETSLIYDKEWNISNKNSNTFEFKEVEINFNSQLKLIIGGSLELYIYEIIGPTIGLEPYSRISSNMSQNPAWRIFAGMDLRAGIETQYISSIIPDKTWTLNILEKEIASGGDGGGNIPPEITGIFSNPENIVVGEQTEFLIAIADDSPQNQLDVRWDVGNDGWDTGFSVAKEFYWTFESQGDYQVKAQARDKEGATHTFTETFKVESSEPYFISFNPVWGQMDVQMSDFPFRWEFSNPQDVESYDLIYSTIVPIGDFEYPFSTTANSFNPPESGIYRLEENTLYYWVVRANLDNGNQVESELLHFETGSFGGGGSGEKTITIQPGPTEGQDVWIGHWVNETFSNSWNTHYPDTSLLRASVGEEDFPIIGNSGGHVIWNIESYLKFNLGQISSGSNILSAKLKLYIINWDNTLVSFLKVLSPWNEQSLGWDTKPSYSIIKSVSITSGAGWGEIEVTDVVRSWINGENNYGFGIKILEGEEGSIDFKSSDHSDGNHRPKLEITYTE